MKPAAEAMPAIADYGMLGDCQSAALLSRDGSVDWWCPSRFDAPSVFGRLLDREAGHWSIRPAVAFEVRRAYVPETMVLETVFRTDRGVLRLRDALALGSGERGHEIGFRSPHALIRVVEAVDGEVPLWLDFAPRPEYGLIEPTLAVSDDQITATSGAGRLSLTGACGFEVQGGRARGRWTLRAGERRGLALHFAAGIAGTPPTALDAHAALTDTVAAWRSWSELHRAYDGPYAEEVRSSARVLQCLTYQPSGAIVAAPTTSLPEEVGGTKNWDYRYAWLRDASLTLKALWVGACPDEAQRFFGFMARAADASRAGEDVQIMFGGRDLAGARRGHLGRPRGPPPLRDVEAHVLGRPRPGGQARPAARRRPRGRALDTGTRRRASRHPRARLARGGQRLHRGFGSDHLDAGVLLMPIMGLVEADDDRMRTTIAAVEDQLASDGLVRRWTGVEGEGAFVICSYWLAQCHALAGNVDRAREIFEHVTGHANDLGLLSEEIDSGGQLIGNFPQGLSHVGLVNAAYGIQRALERSA